VEYVDIEMLCIHMRGSGEHHGVVDDGRR